MQKLYFEDLSMDLLLSAARLKRPRSGARDADGF